MALWRPRDETARENWWAAGRVVDPATGYDERMKDVLTEDGVRPEPSRLSAR
jgi:hypothetical protein